MTGEVRTTCPYCGVGCGVVARRAGGVAEVRGDKDHPANHGRLCSKGAALAETLDLQDRLLHPTVNGRRAGWDEAVATVADGFSQLIERHGPESVAFYVSGQLLTEDYYVANKLMKGYIGSANIDTNSRLCMSSAVAGHLRAFGEDIVSGCYEDLELADLVVLAGSNAAWCHPVLFARLQAARERRPGMRLAVIDPRRTQTASQADLHLPLRPGTDVVLYNGLAAWLYQNGIVDHDFITRHTSGLDGLRAGLARRLDIDAVAAACGLEARAVLAFYRLFGTTSRAVTLFSQGVNQSSSGTDKVNAIINCHLLTGRIGRPGAGPFSVTGQPNAMGGREVGGLATCLAAHMDFDPANVNRLSRFWNVPRVADRPGLKALDMFEAIGEGRIKAIWIMATNPLVSLPDADRARRALASCELVVVSDCIAGTDTATYAKVMLPAAAWGEKDGTVTNSERCISRQRAFLAPPGEARPDWWIISRVAAAMGHGKGFEYGHPADIFDEHARLSAFENKGGERLFNIGGLAGMDRSAYEAMAPVQWPVMPGAPGPCPKRLFPAGRRPARFVAVEYRPPANAVCSEYPLILNSGRLRDHWHSMTRTGKSARLSGHQPEPFTAVHPEDALPLGIADGDLVELGTRWGRIVTRARVDPGQRIGEVFAPIHWNDQYAANARLGALVNPVADPLSGEPEFKHTPARLRPWPAAWQGFLCSRQRLRPGRDSGVDYWVSIRGRDCWRLELAGREPRRRWGIWARRVLGAAVPGADWLEFTDSRAGSYRAAYIREDRLEACLFIAGDARGLPDRGWLAGLFGKSGLEGGDRRSLLAGAVPGGAPAGPVVCACHGVGRDEIVNAIRTYNLKSTDTLGQRLRAGTNCGACLPELRELLAGAKSAA